MMFSDIISHKKTMEATIMKKIKIEFTNERIILASGLAVVGAIHKICLAYSTQFHIILLETEQSAIENIVRTPSATNKCTA